MFERDYLEVSTHISLFPFLTFFLKGINKVSKLSEEPIVRNTQIGTKSSMKNREVGVRWRQIGLGKNIMSMRYECSVLYVYSRIVSTRENVYFKKLHLEESL